MDDTATPLTKRDLVEQKIDKVFATPPTVQLSSGSLSFANMAEVIEAAKMMSMSGPAIPPWLQGNPGGCWAVLIQAAHWGFEPIAVARMSYEVVNKEGQKQISYMSQLIHALIEARAPLRRRLRFTFAGEGESRTCTCIGHIRGEVDPLEYTSPPLAKITPKRSPLWSSDPDQQLSYYCARGWARRYTPDVLMGVYDGEEIDGRRPGDQARDVTGPAALHERLAAAQQNGGSGEGFRPGVVEDTLSGSPAEAKDATSEPGAAEVAPAAPEAPSKTPPPEPAPVQKQGRTPKPPRNPKQYREHVAAWLAETTTEQQIEQRWATEMKLRNQAGVTSDVKSDIRATLIDQRIAELRK